jgi:hypothetical protein
MQTVPALVSGLWLTLKVLDAKCLLSSAQRLCPATAVLIAFIYLGYCNTAHLVFEVGLEFGERLSMVPSQGATCGEDGTADQVLILLSNMLNVVPSQLKHFAE